MSRAERTVSSRPTEDQSYDSTMMCSRREGTPSHASLSIGSHLEKTYHWLPSSKKQRQNLSSTASILSDIKAQDSLHIYKYCTIPEHASINIHMTRK
jgi:hypothetical protein